MSPEALCKDIPEFPLSKFKVSRLCNQSGSKIQLANTNIVLSLLEAPERPSKGLFWCFSFKLMEFGR
jgi:hypothetical protein